MIGRTPIKTRSKAAFSNNRAPEIEDNIRHCNACSDEDNTCMVQCDRCDDWYHFQCVGVNHDVTHQDWSCNHCQVNNGTNRKTGKNFPTMDLPESTNANQVPVPSLVVSSMTPIVTTATRSVVHIPTSLFVFSNAAASTNVNDPLIMPTATKTYFPSQNNVVPVSTLAITSPFSCHTVSSYLNHPIPSVVTGCPLVSSTIIPTTTPLAVSNLNMPRKLATLPLQNNKNQGFGEVASQHSGASKKSMRQKQLQLELQMLDEERQLQESEEARKREYLHKRYNLLKEIASETSSVIEFEEEKMEEKVNKWLESEEINFGHVPDQRVHRPEMGIILPPPVIQQRHSQPKFIQQYSPIEASKFQQPQESFSQLKRISAGCVPRQQGSSIQPNKPNIIPGFREMSLQAEQPVAENEQQYPYYSPPRNDAENNLTRNQVAARQAVSRDLPIFSGTPEEWPLFASTFTTTTSMCGYTAAENLVRLQKCLTGKAYEAVKCMLMHPSNVPTVISTLKMLYGNPEVIVHNLIVKISSTPAPKEDKLDTIVEFALAVQNLYATVQACQLEEYTYNVALLHDLVEKLPPSIKLDWARYRRNFSSVNLSIFAAWLYELAETISPLAQLSSKCNVHRTGKKNTVFLNAHDENEEDEACLEIHQSSTLFQPNPTVSHGFQPNTVDRTCIVCKNNCPSVDKCGRFASLEYNSRWATVKEFGLCRKCLKKHKGTCKYQQVCGKNECTFKHHQLLHNYQRDGSAFKAPSTSETNSDSVVKNSAKRECNMHHEINNKGLFRVVPVIVYGPKRHFKTFAFLDDGSSLTLIDATLASELNVNGKPEPLCLKWTGNKCRMENESMKLDIHISGTGDHHRRYCLQEVHTVTSLDLFRQTVDAERLAHQYKHLQGIPVESYENIQPRILIGIDNANLSYPLKGREGKMHEPVATKTRLGWVIHGGSGKYEPFIGHHSVHTCPCRGGSVDTLEESVHKYFSLEAIGITKPTKSLASKEDQRAQKILQTIVQTDNGHYETRLLWKYDEFRLPNSKPHALRRFYCLEARMKREPELAAVLRAQIDDYRKKGYVRKLEKNEQLKMETRRVWYIPIFPVFNPNKPNKVRIVWDWAAKTCGISLNSMLLKGPDQVVPLDIVLYKFRENKVGLSGDIREMFLQVLIAKEDQCCQLFLWKDDLEDKEPSTYMTQVMTFGACCSPSCAQYVKNCNAEKYAGQFPKAVKAIIEQHYVDDMLISVETEEEAVQLARDVRYIHAQGGFEIRNWISNSPVVIRALEEKKTDEKSLNIGIEMATEKVLGMWWCTATDNFIYKLSRKHDTELLAGERMPTKREVLRTLMAIFDPLGLISNVLIILKILFQEVWRSAIGWDDEIPNNLHEKWNQWLHILPKIQDVSIPRCYRYMTSMSSQTVVQLHTFVDASELGYAAVVYLRFEQGTTIECMIVGAKSRVAPLKFVSIPRLELQSAMIGARLANTISKALSFKIAEKFYWTDARNVLCWIRTDHRQYSVYVGWRVSEILDITEPGSWRWISSKDNVADEATKWKRQMNLSSDSRWFKGPEFLWRSRDTWPTEPFHTSSTKEELRAHLLHHIVIPEPLIQAEKFSKWHRLMRVVATVLRFVGNVRCKAEGTRCTNGPLTSEELRNACSLLYRQVQIESFPDETSILSNAEMAQRRLPKTSLLFNLNPFLDQQHVMRMHGRINACEYASTDARNPVILPKDHHITRLIVLDYHQRYHHRNHETVMNELRQVYRIPKLRVLYRKVRANCQLCKNQRASPQPPPMGDLPCARLAAFTRPFSFIGIDYFGPFSVAVGRRTEKRWGVLITCLTIRAVHLEIAYTMNADSCIKALRNFMARRGVPIKIYSDRGTNFTAASKELKAALMEMDQERIIQEIVSPQTEWVFIPPASPHMGGSWERLVQTVKTNLQYMKPGRNPTDETLHNLLTEIENLINSRPLTHVPVDDPEAPVLTPNHFILGSSSGLKPGTCLDDSAVVLRRSWRTSQVEANIFWRRWLRDYLPDLTRRTKWFNQVKPIEVNDVVIVIDPELPRNCWPKGRIISVNQGKDGQVRSATVQTKTGIYERPATKIAVLDVCREEPVSQPSGVPGGSVMTPSVSASY